MRTTLHFTFVLVLVFTSHAAFSEDDLTSMSARRLYGFCIEAVKNFDNDTSADPGAAISCLAWTTGFIEGVGNGVKFGLVTANKWQAIGVTGRPQKEKELVQKLVELHAQALKTEFACMPDISREVFVRTFVKGMQDNPSLFDLAASDAIRTIWSKRFPCPPEDQLK
jgi:hypothetical protein